MRHRSRLGGHPRGGAAAAAAVGLALLLWICALPLPAAASCCSCRTCPGAAFCIDAVGTLGDCATICTDAGCMNGVYETDDDCAGGCDGFPEAPTLTPSPSPSATPTLTPTATASASPSATAEGSATATGTETETPTVTPSPPPTETPSLTPTATVSGTPTATPTETPSGSPTATPTITPTGTVTGTPTETPALGGAVRYYTGDRPVPGVDVNLIGAPPAATTTDASGHFGFAAVGGGTQTLEPSKQGDVDNGITSLDASHVLQLVAGLRMFNGDQRLACDVTGNGTVSALDATRILQFQADLLQRFEVADLCGSDWVFRPVPAPAANQSVLQPMIGEGVCEPGAITYSPLVPPALGQDFVAILFGDCTGNWNQQ